MAAPATRSRAAALGSIPPIQAGAEEGEMDRGGGKWEVSVGVTVRVRGEGPYRPGGNGLAG